MHTYNTKCQEGVTIESSFAQQVQIIDDDEEILDVGSTITLSKRKDKMDNLRGVQSNIIMSTNVEDKKLDKVGDWRERGQACLDKTTLTNIVSVSDAVEKDFVLSLIVKMRFLCDR